LGDKPKRQEA